MRLSTPGLPGIRTNGLINGGFEVRQRLLTGVTSWTASGVMTADQWQMVTLSGTHTVTSETGAANIDAMSAASLKSVVAGAAGINNAIYQFIENWASYKGQIAAFQARVKTATATFARVEIFDGVTQTFSTYHTGGNAFETLSVVVPVSASATMIRVGISFNGNGTAYMDNATLTMGPIPAPYIPLPTPLDVLLCKRYCQVFGGIAANERFGNAFVTATTAANGLLTFQVPFGGAPTLTPQNIGNMIIQHGAGVTTALTGMTFNNINPNNAGMNVTVAAGLTVGQGALVMANGTAGRILGEWSP